MRVLSKAVAVGAGVAAVGVLTATAALAHGAPYTVTAGSAGSGTVVSVTGTTTGTSPQVIFKDTTTGQQLQCDSAQLGGSITVGTGLGGSPIATIDAGNTTKTIFTNCTGPAGLKFAVTGYGTWNINISDVTSGVATGTVTNIRAHVVATAGPTCSFDVGANTGTFTSSGTSTVDPGTVSGTYTNSTQNLSVPASSPGSLGLWNVNPSASVHNCVANSIIKQGDSASFSATFHLVADNSSYNPIAIS